MLNKVKHSIYIIIILSIAESCINGSLSKVENFHPTSSTGQIVKHKYFTLSYNEKHEQAEWVSYKLCDKYLVKNIDRTNNFREDTLVLTGSANASDYKYSGYDRGHLLPAGSMVHNKQAMSETFYMSNICPQKPNFNRKIWKQLEEKVRYWTGKNDSLFVVSGVIIGDTGKYINNKIAIPKAFYKTILAFNKDEINGIAFILPHKEIHSNILEFVATIDSVENLTGIDFYHLLNNKIEKEFEGNYNIEKW